MDLWYCDAEEGRERERGGERGKMGKIRMKGRSGAGGTADKVLGNEIKGQV
jgi:hypothetical protein